MAVTADLVVVGGGVIGLSCAWEATQRGLSVCVVDPEPGHGAAWVAAGMIAPVTETTFGEGPLVHLFLDAAARWPGFAERLEASVGHDVGFQASGTVVVALDGSDRAEIEQLLAYQHELGLDTSRLSATECRSLVPALSPAIRGGALMPGDHQVDNRVLVSSLVQGATQAGATFVAERAISIELDRDGAASGVVTGTGDIVRGGTILLAAGAETPRLERLPAGVVPRVRPVKGHVVRLRAATGSQAFAHNVRGLVHGRHCYLVPRRDGTVVVGATSEERGYDTTVQAGAVHTLLDDARLLVPAIDEWEFLECLAGLRPGSPDNAPFVGPTSVARLVLATGHYRNGFLLAPITAESVAAYLTSGTIPGPLATFPADRGVGHAHADR